MRKTSGFYEQYRDHITHIDCNYSINNDYLAHFHKAIEIFAIEKGEADAIIDGQIYTAPAGSFIISSDYAVHSYHTRNTSAGYVLIIPYDILKPYHSLLNGKRFASPFLPPAPENEELMLLLKKCHTFHTSELKQATEKKTLAERDGSSSGFIPSEVPSLLQFTSPIHAPIMRSYANLLVGLLIERIGLVDSVTDKGTLLSKDVLRYLQDHFLEQLTLSSISIQFGYSRSRFSHIFNQYFGCSLTDYLNRLRCEYACRLLEEGKKPSVTVTQFALSCGFDSVRTFYRVFKQFTGTTPTEYATSKHGKTLS